MQWRNFLTKVALFAQRLNIFAIAGKKKEEAAAPDTSYFSKEPNDNERDETDSAEK